MGAAVVDEDDLIEEVIGGAVEDAVDGAKEHGEGLIVEGNNDAGSRQLGAVVRLGLTRRRPSVFDAPVQRDGVAERHVDVVVAVRRTLL